MLEPIPLRTLTMLLNYERMTSDPRFEGTYLYDTSFVNPRLADIYLSQCVEGLYKTSNSVV
jgi:hypothetical protein